MSYKTIVAYLASPRNASGIIDAALPLAESFEAHFIGMHAAPGVPVAGTIGAQLPPGVIEQYRQLLLEDSKKIAKIFAERTRAEVIPTEWRGMEAETPRVDLLAAIEGQALCADLLVMGQDDGELRAGELAAEVILGTGRPVLVVPQVGKFEKISERVTVAWDGTRASARAAFDALPLLKRAKQVSVVTVREDHPRKTMNAYGSEEMALVLARHGVKAEAAHEELAGLTVAERLLAHLADLDGDLLVMGCYGHSRLRERLFGGATRDILANMISPVFLSH